MLLLLLYLCRTNSSVAQNQELNYAQIKEYLDAYLQQLTPEDRALETKSKQTYLNFWKDRLNTDGTLGNMPAAFANSPLWSGSYCSTADPADWRLIGPVENASQKMGLINEVYVAPGENYYLCAPSMGGIWKRKKTDAGWRNVTDALNIPLFKINSFAVDPYNSNHLFAATGGTGFEDHGGTHGYGIMESWNDGDTWSVMTSFLSVGAYPEVKKILVDLNQSTSTALVMYALMSKEIYKTVDSGATWQAYDAIDGTAYTTVVVLSGTFFFDMEVDDQSNLFVSTHSPWGLACQFYRRDASSSIWENRSNIISPDPLDPIRQIKFAKADGNNIYALRDILDYNPPIDTVAKRHIMLSLDRGVNWSEKYYCGLSGDSPNPKMEIAHSPGLQKVFWGSGPFFQYDIAGGTASAINQGHVDIRHILVDETISTYPFVFVANDGGVSKVEYNGTSFSYSNLNGNFLPVNEFYDFGMTEAIPDRFLIGATHNNSFTFDGGVWSSFGGGDGNHEFIWSQDPNKGMYSFNEFLGKYEFGFGSTNFSASLATAYRSKAVIRNTLVEYIGHPNEFLYSGHGDSLAFINRGKVSPDTWIDHYLVPDFEDIGEISVAPSNTNVWYVSNWSVLDGGPLQEKMKLKKTVDGGVSFIDLGSSPVYSSYPAGTLLGPLYSQMFWNRISDIQVAPYNANKLWVTLTGITADEKLRVLFSENGGLTWFDYSEGLPGFPCQSITYMQGSNDLLFVGSETGVYYRDRSMAQWQCFDENMPKCIITDLVINHCTHELMASTYGRALWKTPIPLDICELQYTGTQTFAAGQVQRINRNIRIMPGATFTIKGTYEMGRNTKIFIERGGRLVLDGGTLTNDCNYLWEGIEVWGNSAMAQQPESVLLDPNQGTLVIINGSTIEHARSAVTTQRNGVSNYNRGRIFADNAIFRNNRFSLEIMWTSAANVGRFNNIKFLTTTTLPDPGYTGLGTSTHVRLYNAHSIKFTNCLWQNTGTFSLDARGTGISSIDSDFDVDGNCTAYSGALCVNRQLAFSNLFRGIIFQSTSLTNKMNVFECEFNNVVQGIHIVGGNNCVVRECEFFNMNGYVSALVTFDSWGVNLESTAGATVQDNTFSSGLLVAPPFTNFYPRGIIANNTGSIQAMMRRNTFEAGRLIGIHGFFNDSKAVVRCNDFFSEFDLIVTGDDASRFPNQGVASPTNSSMLAGNEFHNVCSGNNQHIYYHARNPDILLNRYLRYYYHNSPAVCAPTCFNFEPLYKVYAYVRPFAKTAGSCTDNIIPSMTIIENSTTQLEQLRKVMEDDNEYLLSLMHPENEITQASYAQLKNTSVLSDEVLRKVIERSADFGDMEKVNTIIAQNFPLPADLMDLALSKGINQSSLLPSEGNNESLLNTKRADLISEISYYETALHQAQVDYVVELISAGQYDLAMETAQQSLNNDAIAIGMTSMLDINKEIANQYLASFVIKDVNDQVRFDWLKLLYTLSTEGRDWKSMTESELNSVKELSEQMFIESAYAKAVLDLLNGTESNPYVDPFEPSDYKSEYPIRTEVLIDSRVKISPVPFTNYLTFDLTGLNAIGNLSLKIVDMTGRNIQNLTIANFNTENSPLRIDTSKIPVGAYVIDIVIGDLRINKEVVKIQME